MRFCEQPPAIIQMSTVENALFLWVQTQQRQLKNCNWKSGCDRTCVCVRHVCVLVCREEKGDSMVLYRMQCGRLWRVLGDSGWRSLHASVHLSSDTQPSLTHTCHTFLQAERTNLPLTHLTDKHEFLLAYSFLPFFFHLNIPLNTSVSGQMLTHVPTKYIAF